VHGNFEVVVPAQGGLDHYYLDNRTEAARGTGAVQVWQLRVQPVPAPSSRTG
jgi:hypothetical protein